MRRSRETEIVLEAIHELKGILMALADTLTQLQSEDTEIAADVANAVSTLQSQGTQLTALQSQISQLEANGNISADQLTALQNVANDLQTSHTTLSAALPAPPAAAAPSGS
jgi:chromosome segregation ATPase